MGLKFGNKNKSSFKMKGAPIHKGTAMYKKAVAPIKQGSGTTTTTSKKVVTNKPIVTTEWDKPIETFKGGEHGVGEIIKKGTQTTTTSGHVVTKTVKKAWEDYSKLNPSKTYEDFKIEKDQYIEDQKKTTKKDLVQKTSKIKVEIIGKKDTIPPPPMQTLNLGKYYGGSTYGGTVKKTDVYVNGQRQLNAYTPPVLGKGQAGHGGHGFTDRQVDHLIDSGGWEYNKSSGNFTRQDPTYQLMTGVNNEQQWVKPGSDKHVQIAKGVHMKKVTENAAAEFNTLKENGELTNMQLKLGVKDYTQKAYNNEYKRTANMDVDKVKDDGLWFMRPDVEFSGSSARLNSKMPADEYTGFGGSRWTTYAYLPVDSAFFNDTPGNPGVKTNEDLEDLYSMEGEKYRGDGTSEYTVKMKLLEAETNKLLQEAKDAGHTEAVVSRAGMSSYTVGGFTRRQPKYRILKKPGGGEFKSQTTEKE